MTIYTAFIGVNRYEDPHIDELKGAKRDALALWALWKDTVPQSQTTLLINDQATVAGIRGVLENTLGAAGEDDVVILSFSGHGTRNHRLVAYDTRNTASDLGATTIPMEELAAIFKASKARQVVCILDCCFSGHAPARVIEDTPVQRGNFFDLEVFDGAGRFLIAASKLDEPALEYRGHGLLTNALIECLKAAADPVDLATVLSEVQKRVRAEAEGLGETQTPTWTGHVVGGFVVPKLVPGALYQQHFPHKVGVNVTKQIDDLSAFGIPLELLEEWSQSFPDGLNDLQLEAVNRHRILEGKSLLVVAPTSSGKTFIGELAAARAAAEGEKAVFLLPYKALCNEKFDDFTTRYSDRLGFRVVRCTGDYQDQKNAFLRGKYEIALLTYEEFLNLAVGNPQVLNKVGLVVLDEAQFITSPNRGMAVELLLTYLRASRERGIKPQLIALSAVIGDTNHFEEWLGCEALITTKRPVPLIEGVLDRSGLFQYLDPDTKETKLDQLLPADLVRMRTGKPSSQDLIVPLTQQLFQNNPSEKLIVFRNVRGKAEGAANYLALDLGLPPATSALESLPNHDLSKNAQRLRTCLEGGTAFHNSNLTREEREVVERAFRDRDGQVRVLGATTTVAAGINTPASTVILAETEFKGEDGRPFTVAEYKNMVGRAGRLGYNEKGRSIILANHSLEREQLFEKYVLGEPEALRSSFDEAHLETWLLRLLGQIKAVDRHEVPRLIANTYGGFLRARNEPGWRERMDRRFEDVIADLIGLELLEEEDNRIRLTLLGRDCAHSALAFSSVKRWIRLVGQADAAHLTLERIMALMQVIKEMDDTYTPFFKNGKLERTWAYELSRRFDEPLARALQGGSDDPLDHFRRCKRVLVLTDWIKGVAVEDIETTYTNNLNVSMAYGDQLRIATNTRLYLRSLLGMTMTLRPAVLFADDEVNSLMRRLEVGLPNDALPLLEITGLNRGEYMTLYSRGIRSENAFWALEEHAMADLLGGQRAIAVQKLRRK